MRIGFALPTMGPLAGPDAITRVAQRVEAVGLDAVWVAERSLWPVAPKTQYRFGPLPEHHKIALDPLDALSFVAGQTSRVVLGTSVLNLPWYSPLLLARRLASLDVLSGGRLLVGLGSGWSEDEHDAAGSDYRTRGRRSDEAIALLKAVWTTDPVEFAGEWYRVPLSYVSLKPVQRPHPPLLWGGWGDAARRRAALHCDGWHPAGLRVAELAGQFAEVREIARAAGRPPDALRFASRNRFEVTAAPLGSDRPSFCGTPEQIAGDLAAAEAAGVDDLVLDGMVTPAVDTVADLLERVDALARIAGRTGRAAT